MENLPYAIAGPLHVLPWWIIPLLWLMFFVLIALLVKRYLGRVLEIVNRWRTGKKYTREEGGREFAIIPVIESIEEENLKKKTYRRGLFQLSEVLKSHIERKSGVHVEEMTSAEISRNISSREPGKFFREMDVLVFREKNPDRNEFIMTFGKAKKLATLKIKAAGGEPDA